MQRLYVAFLFVVLVACAARPAVRPPPPPPSLDDVAIEGLNEGLRELGFRVEVVASPARGRAVFATRGGVTWYLAANVESSAAPEGPKVLLRVSVFREPGRNLRGEVAPFVIAANARKESMARDVGRRAAAQFADHFTTE